MPKRVAYCGPDDELTELVIAAFLFVYNVLGHGLFEAVYQRAMRAELASRGIQCRYEVPFALYHRGVNIGDYRADLIVGDTVVVECKAVEKISKAHVSQVTTYLKASGLRTGLLLNFGPEPEIRRVSR